MVASQAHCRSVAKKGGRSRWGNISSQKCLYNIQLSVEGEVYSYFKKVCRREWRTANVERRLHDRKELWLRYLIGKISYVAFTLRENEYTNIIINVCLRVLGPEDRRNSRFFQLRNVPRFVWTAYCLGRYIDSHKKFRNIALRAFLLETPMENEASAAECWRTWTNQITCHWVGIID